MEENGRWELLNCHTQPLVDATSIPMNMEFKQVLEWLYYHFCKMTCTQSLTFAPSTHTKAVLAKRKRLCVKLRCALSPNQRQQEQLAQRTPHTERTPNFEISSQNPSDAYHVTFQVDSNALSMWKRATSSTQILPSLLIHQNTIKTNEFTKINFITIKI